MNIRAALFRSEPSMDLTLVHNEERLAEELAASARPGRLIQQTDSNGMTYLHHAAKNGALGSVGVLLQAGGERESDWKADKCSCSVVTCVCVCIDNCVY